MKKALTKIKNDTRLAWHSLLFGLKAADNAMQSQVSGEDGIENHQQVKPNGIFADMLEQKVTKEVEETRDKYYRVLREADKYDATNMKIVGNISENGDEQEEFEFVGNVRKKTKADFMKHATVYETPDTKLILIQDVIQIASHSNFEAYVPTGLYDYDVNIDIERDFIPRFKIEKFAKKVVVRKGDNPERSYVDIYLPTEASQFGKIDAILISNLFTIYNEKNFRGDIVNFDKISWCTERAWNCGDAHSFAYDDIHPVDIIVFDGNFVITYDCHVIDEARDLAKKYKTEDLDKKYEEEAPKKKEIDLFTVQRHIDKMEKKNKSEIDLDNISDTGLRIS